jgi:hypothetical protein
MLTAVRLLLSLWLIEKDENEKMESELKKWNKM